MRKQMYIVILSKLFIYLLCNRYKCALRIIYNNEKCTINLLRNVLLNETRTFREYSFLSTADIQEKNCNEFKFFDAISLIILHANLLLRSIVCIQVHPKEKVTRVI